MAKSLFALLLALAASCARAQGLPELGDTSASVLSPQFERRVGEEAYRDIRGRDARFLDDPEITQYVADLGGRLAAASGQGAQAFQFFVLRDRTINAFAMPGGYIGVHTGLLLAAQSESEIASVLAHEISHVTQHHIARMLTRESQYSPLSLAAVALALIAARSNPDMAQAAVAGATAGSIQAQLDYSREFEREADRLGFALLADAGFDVQAMPAFFMRLQRAGRFVEGAAPAYLRTHPLTTERMADMQNRAHSAQYRQTPDSLDFHFVRARLKADEGFARDAVAAAEAQLKDRRYASEAGARYALVASLTRARLFERARAELGLLRRLVPDHPMVDLLDARLRRARGDTAGASDILRAAEARYRDYAPIRYALVDTLQALSRHEDALVELEDLLKSHPRDPRLYGMRARSLGALGRALLEHQALAEQYYLMGTLPAAIEQLQIAQKSGQGNFYELSMIEARLRQFRAELSEQRTAR